MNKGEMKRLGDYIREVDVRNRDLEVTKLMGINIGKYFMPSVANVIGTDLSNYKIVGKGQFACNLMHVGRDEKIPIALLYTNERIIVSPAYWVFEVSNTTQLLPDYLMLWFRRNEFDRNAWFYTDSDVRGGMSKEALMDMTLPIPPIEQQQKIVAEYEAITRRIRLNEQIIVKLEETAQALYRKMFVDGIDKENLPEGWRMGVIGELFELQRGFDLPSQDRIAGQFPIYASTGITGYNNQFKVTPPCVLTGRSGSIGEVFYVDERCWPLNTTLWVKDFKNTPPLFVYYKLKELELGKTIAGFAAVPTLNRNDVHMIKTFIPPMAILFEFERVIQTFFYHQKVLNIENAKLTEMKMLLLFKL